MVQTSGMNGVHPSSEHRIIAVGEHKYAKHEWDTFATEYEVTRLTTTSRPELIAAIKELASKAKYDAIVLTPGGGDGPMNEAVLGPLAGSLHYVGGVGAGFDKHDLQWLNSIGAWYTSTPKSINHFTSLSAFTLILQCIRRTTQAEATIRRGEWRKGFVSTPDPRDLVIGIVGMGNVGKLVRNYVQAIGVKAVIYNNRTRLPAEEEGGATYATFQELLEQSDVISIHCPLSPATHHLFSTKEFAAMKPGSMIVNTSRGPVIDEEALVQAINSGHIDRAGLDVFEFEPKVHPGLIASEHVSVYPHGGFATAHLYRDLELESLSSLREYIETGRPSTAQNNPVGFEKA